MTTTVLLADDHRIVREGIRALLEKQGFEVVGEAADGRQAVDLASELDPDVVVLDVFMPTLNGIDAARELARRAPRSRLLMLTASEDDAHVVDALQAGATGYLAKTRAATDLGQAIREVASGGVFLSKGSSRPLVAAYLEGRAQGHKTDGPLTARERQVLQLVAEGHTTRNAAEKLGISVKTVESHRGRIMKKLDVHETASLVRYAIRHGLIQP